MIKRVFDDNDRATYYCTLCNRPFKPLHEANEHAKFCGQAVPTQPVFRSYTTAATVESEIVLAEAYRCGHEAGSVAEREACAKVCEEHTIPSELANAIRARRTT